VGRKVMRVSATDIDDGKNFDVRYSFVTDRLEDVVYFRIDRESYFGVIFFNQTIDISNAKVGQY